MKKSEMFGFSLETDDRTEEEKSRQTAKRDGRQEAPKAPMDTDYQEEMEETTPKIRFNLNFDKWGSPCLDNMILPFSNSPYLRFSVSSSRTELIHVERLDLLTHVCL